MEYFEKDVFNHYYIDVTWYYREKTPRNQTFDGGEIRSPR